MIVGNKNMLDKIDEIFKELMYEISGIIHEAPSPKWINGAILSVEDQQAIFDVCRDALDKVREADLQQNMAAAKQSSKGVMDFIEAVSKKKIIIVDDE
jgi:hypothetical protein